MTDKTVTPIIKAEQMIRSFVGGNYLLEILVWITLCMVFFVILYFLMKKMLNSKSGNFKPKNTKAV